MTAKPLRKSSQKSHGRAKMVGLANRIREGQSMTALGGAKMVGLANKIREHQSMPTKSGGFVRGGAAQEAGTVREGHGACIDQ